MELVIVVAAIMLGVWSVGREHSKLMEQNREHFNQTIELLNRTEAQLRREVHNQLGRFGCDVLGRRCADCPHRQPPALPAVSEDLPTPEPAPLPTARLLKRGR